MIISASRRTDIPAFYSDWMLNRLQQGQVLVRNPFNAHQVSRLSLDPQTVDCIVFWTKNPAPMLPRLAEIERLGYRYYFQFTLTAYGRDMERTLPPKAEVIATFQKLAERIGPERVLWRFDPILLSRTLTPAYHLDGFEYLAEQLGPYTRTCTISFLRLYEKCKRNLQDCELLALDENEKRRFVGQLAAIAKKNKLRLAACCDPFLSEQCGIESARCIDDRVLAALLGQPIHAKKDPGQRPGCGCVVSVDIGAYNSCPHGCRYCYANSNERVASRNRAAHSPDSPLLIGGLTGKEIVSDKKHRSLFSPQCRLF